MNISFSSFILLENTNEALELAASDTDLDHWCEPKILRAIITQDQSLDSRVWFLALINHHFHLTVTYF